MNICFYTFVHSLIDIRSYNPWDTGTHRPPPVNASWVPPFNPTDPAIEVIAALKETNADGIDGDVGAVEVVSVDVAGAHVTAVKSSAI